MVCAVHTFESKWRVFYKEGSMIDELGQSVRTSSISFARIFQLACSCSSMIPLCKSMERSFNLCIIKIHIVICANHFNDR